MGVGLSVSETVFLLNSSSTDMWLVVIPSYNVYTQNLLFVSCQFCGYSINYVDINVLQNSSTTFYIYLSWASLYPSLAHVVFIYFILKTFLSYMLMFLKCLWFSNFCVQILQNFGKVDRTSDEIFEEHLQNFTRQQNAANRLQKEFNNYIRCIRGQCTKRLLRFYYLSIILIHHFVQAFFYSNISSQTIVVSNITPRHPEISEPHSKIFLYLYISE